MDRLGYEEMASVSITRLLVFVFAGFPLFQAIASCMDSGFALIRR